MCIYTYKYIYIYIRTCAYMYMCFCMYVHIYIYIYHIYIYIYIYILMTHIYMYVFIFIYMYVSIQITACGRLTYFAVQGSCTLLAIAVIKEGLVAEATTGLEIQLRLACDYPRSASSDDKQLTSS